MQCELMKIWQIITYNYELQGIDASRIVSILAHKKEKENAGGQAAFFFSIAKLP